MIHHGIQHGRHCERVRHAVLFDGSQTRFGIECRYETAPAAPHDQRIDHRRIRNVKHRSAVQPHPILRHGQRHHAVQCVGAQVLVGEHHALGSAGRPTGVKQRYDVVFIWKRPVELGRRRYGQVGFVIRHALRTWAVSREQVLQLRQACAQGGRHGREAIVHHQQARTGIREAEADLRRVPSDIDRHNDRTRQRHGMVQLEIPRRVQHQHRHAVTRLDAQITQRIGNPRDPFDEPGKGDRAFAVADRDRTRVKLYGAPQRISQVHRYGLPSTITQATDPGPPKLCTSPSSASRTCRVPACPRNCVTTS